MRDRHHTSKKCGVGNNNEKKIRKWCTQRENREIKIKKFPISLSLSILYFEIFLSNRKKIEYKIKWGKEILYFAFLFCFSMNRNHQWTKYGNNIHLIQGKNQTEWKPIFSFFFLNIQQQQKKNIPTTMIFVCNQKKKKIFQKPTSIPNQTKFFLKNEKNFLKKDRKKRIATTKWRTIFRVSSVCVFFWWYNDDEEK